MTNVQITAKTKLPLTSGKEATLTLKDGEVEIVTPVSFKRPKTTLADLRVALEDLEAAADPLTTQIGEQSGRLFAESAERERAEVFARVTDRLHSIGAWAPTLTWYASEAKLAVSFEDGERFERTFGIDGPRPMYGEASLNHVAQLAEAGEIGRAKVQAAKILEDLIPEAGAHFRRIADVPVERG